uniref:Uncharacterized protein n=1 Tax=Arundo donax TaxID=35708 RepID=A0A0A9DTE2_ARUDO
MVIGAFPPIIATKFLKAQQKLFVVSLVNNTPANITLWKWLLTPTNIPNGML